MKCSIVKDLIPLCIDKCCSDESEKLVREHIASCADCREVYNSMAAADYVSAKAPSAPQKTSGLSRISQWKASILQSLALFASFALITLGVTLESKTPNGSLNGLWSFAVIVPATAFMLSLANLYFVRLYKSKRAFSLACCLITLAICALGFLWALLHYRVFASPVTSPLLRGIVAGGIASVVLSAASFALARLYARLVGKE